MELIGGASDIFSLALKIKQCFIFAHVAENAA